MRTRVLAHAASIVVASFLLVIVQSCGGPKEPAAHPGEHKANAEKGSAAPSNPLVGAPPAAAFEPGAIPKPGTEKWAPTEAKALDVAAKVSKAIANMRNTYGEAITLVKTPVGAGQVKLVYKISGPGLFRVDYVVPSDVPSPGFVIVDGKRRKVLGEKGIASEPIGVPSPIAKLSAEELVKRWPREYSRLMFAALTDGQDTFRRFVEGLARGHGGFRLSLEERRMEKGGKKYRNYRLLAERSQSAAKRLGPCQIEIVVDADRYLPVTVRVKSQDPQGRPWEQQWSAGWGFDAKFTADQVTSLE